MTTDVQTSIRFTNAEVVLLQALQDKLGVSRSDVIRVAIRRLAELEGVRVDPKKPKK